MTAPYTTDPAAMPEHVRRRATDRWNVRVGIASRAVLPPALAVSFAVTIAHVAEASHTFNMAMALGEGLVLAASFGPTMFEKWIVHREEMRKEAVG